MAKCQRSLFFDWVGQGWSLEFFLFVLFKIKLFGTGRTTGLQVELYKRLIFIFLCKCFQMGRDLVHMLTSIVSRRLVSKVLCRRGLLEFVSPPGHYRHLIDKRNFNFKSQRFVFGKLTFGDFVPVLAILFWIRLLCFSCCFPIEWKWFEGFPLPFVRRTWVRHALIRCSRFLKDFAINTLFLINLNLNYYPFPYF
jgi:hypothetical protein